MTPTVRALHHATLIADLQAAAQVAHDHGRYGEAERWDRARAATEELRRLRAMMGGNNGAGSRKGKAATGRKSKAKDGTVS